ncbi:MAG: hypothetical protein ACLRQF_21010 [Thomasclavelia ramosa]
MFDSVSSGTTALAIGLIRSGLMTLEQSIGIVKVPTSVGYYVRICRVKVSQYAVYFIILGAFNVFKKQKTKYMGRSSLDLDVYSMV